MLTDQELQSLRNLGNEAKAAADEIEVLAAKLARTRERAVLEFAAALHSLPAEDGWHVGPARVKFNAHGALEGGPFWATQEDTERWAHAFLQGPNVAGKRLDPVLRGKSA